ncbi:orange carotenoid protein [Fischerella thermalis CCMEE 5318]|uniref:Orange carotenoid protein n=2 Tax=Fischerella TaxID=1190 RepID=A0A2N6LFR9_9CYAN|nr:orange carotenoid protein [Fischerella thermalis CCMEE 5318]
MLLVVPSVQTIDFGAIMTFTTDSAQNRFSNTFNYSTQAVDAVASTVAVFTSLSVDDQLAVLWYAYTEMGRSITPAATGAARLQLAEGLLNQIKQMTHEEQLQVMRDLAAKKNTQFCRSYGILSANTKLAFWYELSELMVKGFVVPMPSSYQLSRDGVQVLETLKELDFGQQITVLRKVVTDMGVDPLAD